MLKSENAEKFPAGPTISSPGPILLKVAITDVTVVVTSKLSKETINIAINDIIMYANINKNTPDIVYSSTTFPSIFTLFTLLG